MAQSTLYMDCDYAESGYVAGDEVCRPYYGGGWDQKQLAKAWLPKPASPIEKAIKRIAKELEVEPDAELTAWVRVQAEDADDPEAVIRAFMEELVPPPPPEPESDDVKAARIWSALKTRH